MPGFRGQEEGCTFLPSQWPKVWASGFIVRSGDREATLVFTGTGGSCHGLGELVELGLGFRDVRMLGKERSLQ